MKDFTEWLCEQLGIDMESSYLNQKIERRLEGIAETEGVTADDVYQNYYDNYLSEFDK